MSAPAPARPTAPVAEVAGVGRTYDSAGRFVEALSGVDASFVAGRVAAVAGPSGSGKSTLLRILAGLDVASEGAVVVCGIDLSRASARSRRRLRRGRVSFLFQRPSDNLVSYLTAGQHVRMALERPGDAALDVEDALALVGLEHAAGRRPHELSGGEQQRLAVVLAIAVPPAVLLLDEPTAELDRASASKIVELLALAAGRGSAVVAASHDPVVVDAADDVVRLAGGKVSA